MIFIDSHVHIYGCFSLKAFLDSALTNFEDEACLHTPGRTFSACLLLTEGARDNWFSRLKNFANKGLKIGNQAKHQWVFHFTRESSSLLARRGGVQELYLMAGRQIITSEELEVLALITERQFEDGKPLKVVIECVKESGGIPVIPWGFGKWMGRRGKVLERRMKESSTHDCFLGDNGGRPSFLPRPTHFNLAESLGIKILPGSDPLPFASEFWRPGSFGFSVEGSITPNLPASDLKRILLNQKTSIRAYGKLEHPFRFCRNQIKMQFNKQLQKRIMVSA